jgi:hypothetical protein
MRLIFEECKNTSGFVNHLHQNLSLSHFYQITVSKLYPIITITVLGIIHRPIFYLKHDISETEFCLCLQVEPTQLGPINRASCLWAPATIPKGTETSCIYWAQLSRFHLKTET